MGGSSSVMGKVAPPFLSPKGGKKGAQRKRSEEDDSSELLREVIGCLGEEGGRPTRLLAEYHSMVKELMRDQGSALPVRQTSLTMLQHARGMLGDAVELSGLFLQMGLLEPGRVLPDAFGLVAGEVSGARAVPRGAFLELGIEASEAVRRSGQTELRPCLVAGQPSVLLAVPVFFYQPGDLAIEFYDVSSGGLPVTPGGLPGGTVSSADKFKPGEQIAEEEGADGDTRLAGLAAIANKELASERLPVPSAGAGARAGSQGYVAASQLSTGAAGSQGYSPWSIGAARASALGSPLPSQHGASQGPPGSPGAAGPEGSLMWRPPSLHNIAAATAAAGSSRSSFGTSTAPERKAAAVVVFCLHCGNASPTKAELERLVPEATERDVRGLLHETKGFLESAIEIEARQEHLFQSQLALAAVMNTSHLFLQNEDLERSIASFEGTLCAALNVSNCYVMLLDEPSRSLWFKRASHSFESLAVANKSLPAHVLQNRCITMARVSQGRLVAIDTLRSVGGGGSGGTTSGGSGGSGSSSSNLEDIVEPVEFDLREHEAIFKSSVMNLLCVPLLSEVAVLGVVLLENKSVINAIEWSIATPRVTAAVAAAAARREVPKRGSASSPSAASSPSQSPSSSSSAAAAAEATTAATPTATSGAGSAEADQKPRGSLQARGSLVGGARSSSVGFASGLADGDQQSAFKSTSMTLEDSVSAFSHADMQVALSCALEASAWFGSKHTEVTYMLSQNNESDSDLRSLLESYDPQKQRALASSASTGSFSISEEKATIQTIRPQVEYSATELREMDRKLGSWGFDVLSEPPDALVGYALRIYDQFDVIGKFNLKSDTVAAFLTEVKNSYLPNPYHNWHHGFSVLHATSLMLRSGVMQLLKLAEVLALLIAAIGHDVGHPGTNNDFQVHSSSNFAISYNDHSVLENFHASTTFRILQLPHCNLLKDMSLQTHAGIRETVIKAILSTDISVHFKMVATLKQKYLDAAQKVAAGAAEAAHQISAAGAGPQLRPSGPSFSSFKNRRSTLMLNMSLRPVSGGSTTDKQKQAQGQHPGGGRGQSIGLGPDHTGSSIKLNPNSSFQRKHAVRRRSSIELKSEGKDSDMDLDADQVFSIEERSDRIVLVEAVIHSADLANSVLRFDLYRKWTHLVVQEFYDQSLTEKKLGLPTLPHMCNPPDDEKALANLQLHFIDYVVAPLWAIMRDLFPDLSPRYDQLEINRTEWRRMQKEFELLKDASAASAQAESKSRDSVINDDDEDAHSAERNP